MFAVVLAAGVLWSGCSGKYKRADVELDSPEAKRVIEMIDAVRRAGKEGLAAYIDAGSTPLEPSQKKMLLAALMPLATSDGARLVAMDRFGPDIYRASIELTAEGKTSVRGFCVVRAGDRFHWAAIQ